MVKFGKTITYIKYLIMKRILLVLEQDRSNKNVPIG